MAGYLRGGGGYQLFRTTANLQRFAYGPRPTTLAQVEAAGYATLPIAESDVVGLVADLALKAPIASPVFTGDPQAPTPSPGDADTSVATTAFVTAAITAAPNKTITLSGDITGAGTAAITTTLPVVNANVGSFTNANLTVNAKGQVTAAANGAGGASGLSGMVAGQIPIAATATTITSSANLSGDVVSTPTTLATTIQANTVTTAKILNSNITYAKIQNVVAQRMLGNPTGSAAAPSEVSLGTNLTFSGTQINAAGSVASVGLSVPATSILGVTGSPVTGSGTLGLTTTGTSGGIPYFSSTSQLTSSALLTAARLTMGGGAGAAPADSSVQVATHVISSGFGATTESCGLELGGQRTGNGIAYIDLHAASGTDYELRINRASGTNGAASLTNTGTGAFLVQNGAGVQVQGTNTNDSAAAGYVGEYVTANSAASALTSGAATAVTSVSLTAGDWDVEGIVFFSAAGTTVVSALTVGVSTTSGGFATQGLFGRTDYYGVSITGLNMTLLSGSMRFSLATTTSVFLNCLATFTTSTMTRAGQIAARRVR